MEEWCLFLCLRVSLAAIVDALGKFLKQLVRGHLLHADLDLMQIGLVVGNQLRLSEGLENVLMECASELHDELGVSVEAFLPPRHCGFIKAGAGGNLSGGHSIRNSGDVGVPARNLLKFLGVRHAVTLLAPAQEGQRKNVSSHAQGPRSYRKVTIVF